MLRSFQFLVVLFVFGSINSLANSQDEEFSRTVPSGDFRNPVFWSPFVPDYPILGPGGSNDNVIFDLDQSFLDLYTINDVNGVNLQLIIENDSVNLDITNYETVSNGTGSSSSVIVGASSGDTAIAVFNGGDGSEFRSVRSIIGHAIGSNGSAFVNGAGFSWNNSDDLIIGNQGIGNLIVSNDGQVTSSFGTIANTSTSVGTVVVDGPDSEWMMTGGVRVGTSGQGTLCITDQGLVRCFAGGVVGRNVGSSGTVVVENEGAWVNDGNHTIGRVGAASLTVQSGGTVTTRDSGFIARFLGSDGSVNVSGTNETDSEWTISDNLHIGGNAGPSFENGGTGTLSIGFGGKVIAYDDTFLFPGGTIDLDGGILATDAINFQGGGQFNFLRGTLDVDIFNGDLVNDRGRLSPGRASNEIFVGGSTGSTLIDGDYTQNDFGHVEIEIGGVGAGTDYDFVNVTGDSFLGGFLTVNLINGFVPDSSDAFTVFSANPGNLLGFFVNAGDNERLNTPDGIGSFLVRYGVTSPNPNQVILSDFELAFILGDVNGDGVVSLLDVAPFVEVLSIGPYNPAADINIDGEVNLLDVAPFVALLAG